MQHFCHVILSSFEFMLKSCANYFWQAYYLNVQFPVEKAPTEMISLTGPAGVSENGVKVSKLVNYPVRGLVFTEGKTINDLAEVMSNACICLQENNIPFNVLISDHGRRIYLFPQVSDLSFIYTSYVLIKMSKHLFLQWFII
jgi:hypothetical protein